MHAISALLKLGRNLMSVDDAIRKLYYDLAGAPEPVAPSALLQVADPSRVLHGSDYPFTPAPVAADLAAVLNRFAPYLAGPATCVYARKRPRAVPSPPQG